MSLPGYELQDRIAIGGMAEIFRAQALEGERAGQTVVVKRLLPQNRIDKDFVTLFVDEGKLCVKLRHPNIVRTYKVWKHGIDYFMELELVDGQSFRQLLDAAAKGEPLPLGGVVWLLDELCKALDYVHRAEYGGAHVSLVHRDVNPANVLVGRDGVCKLTDFGVAEGEGMGAKKVHGALRGTLGYMAPEQVVGKNVDKRADLFAVGLMLWEATANRPAFTGASDFALMESARDAQIPSIRDLWPHVPDVLEKILKKGLHKDPQHRFQTALEWRKALAMLGPAGFPADRDALLARLP